MPATIHEMPARPHPFLWVYASALTVGVLAAALAPARASAVALGWNPIYRVEVGLVALAAVYIVGVTGWMAWHGRAFRRLELPGGAAIERDAEELDAAVSAFGTFQDTMVGRLDALEEAVEHLTERLDGSKNRGELVATRPFRVRSGDLGRRR
jgi:hypothetical protein